jgi:nucleoside-diphosphate-sugar epimerase
MTMRRIVVSGGIGFVGRFIVETFLSQGREATVACRTPPQANFFSRSVRYVPLVLGGPLQAGLFDDVDCFVHAAFDHLPGQYRGGEGNDPTGFRHRNLDGSIALFDAARAAGVSTTVFLSSRAVYGTQPSGVPLTEDTPPCPDTLYGEIKLAVEDHLLSMADADFRPIALRVTGVYGPAGTGRADKWHALIEDYLAGRPVAPRVATEVHGEDVAQAVSLLSADRAAAGIFNVSDIVVDRHDLLTIVRDAAARPSEGLTPAPLGARHVARPQRGGGSDIAQTSLQRASIALHPLPARADASSLNVMSTEKLRALGWRPGGVSLLEQTVRRMVQDKSSRSDSIR